MENTCLPAGPTSHVMWHLFVSFSCTALRKYRGFKVILSKGLSTMNENSLIKEANKYNNFLHQPDNAGKVKPLYIGSECVGLVRSDVESELSQHSSSVFSFRSQHISLVSHLDSCQKRSSAMANLLAEMRQKSNLAAFKSWRDELVDVHSVDLTNNEPLMQIERAAANLFGIRQFGADINGLVNHSSLGLCLWMQRRALTKPTWPGRLDNFVGGGITTGLKVVETAIKEAYEEANVDEHLAKKLKPIGNVSFVYESERGIIPQTAFVFDLELPESFEPSNNDGEVDDFVLVPMNDVRSHLVSSSMKTTSMPVMLDCLIRHGIVNPDNEPNLPSLVESLHVPLSGPYSIFSAFKCQALTQH